MPADVSRTLRIWDDLKQKRMPRESEWQMIADYFAPRKTFTCQAMPGELIRRRVTASIGPRLLARGAGLLGAMLIDHTMPFIGANVEGGLFADGRKVDLDAKSRDYLSNTEWLIHAQQMRAKSNYLSSTSQVCVELEGFGTGIRWTGRKRGFGPVYKHIPLRACWIDENEDGQVDTLYRRFVMPVWRACERYPQLREHEAIAKLLGDEKKALLPLELLHAVQPRLYGRAGAVATAKPFESVVIAVEHKCIAEESGYDSFPYSVARLNVEEGSTYGTGLAWHALPNVLVINALQQGIELATYLRLNPPTLEPINFLPKALDRRPNARNQYDPMALGFQGTVREAFQRLDIAGDPGVGKDQQRALENEVEQIFFIDWMNLADGVQKTAEEIRERRDLRLRALSSLVPYVDRDLIAADADRTLDVLKEEGRLPPAPDAIGGKTVEWDYRGPLAILQKRGRLEAVDRMFDLAMKAKTLEAEGPETPLHVEEMLRTAFEAVGLPGDNMRGRDEMEQRRAAANDAAQDQADAEQAEMGARAFRDMGQGVATLDGGLGGGRPAEAA